MFKLIIFPLLNMLIMFYLQICLHKYIFMFRKELFMFRENSHPLLKIKS